jgi:hypothetical protein
MGPSGLPRFGVPGIGGRACALREVGDVYESLSVPGRDRFCGTLEAEDRRRRWVKDWLIEEEEDAEVGVKDARSMVVGQKVPRPFWQFEMDENSTAPTASDSYAIW